MSTARTVRDELEATLGLLTEAMNKLALAEFVTGRARDAAKRIGNPTDSFESHRRELEALVALCVEKAKETIQKLAEDEAGSRG